MSHLFEGRQRAAEMGFSVCFSFCSLGKSLRRRCEFAISFYNNVELVRGIRITDYCNQGKLSTKERLDLFTKVCQAIQHAHQKGIIHRDIKPSNILVTLHDGVPVPKVIDFGIAKATEGRLTDETVYTQLHQFIGTPAYMSPEQAEMSGLDIDTRSDIYSLGVLLYELLTGNTPFDGQQLVASGIDAMRKTIREKEPVRPSTRLTLELSATAESPKKPTPGWSIPSEAEITDDSRLRLRLREQIHRVKGDLDWIVMKCLEKDRARRYDTANSLVADLNRHLNNEPVIARPPSAVYKFQKAFRRNTLAFTAAAAVATALLVGTGVSTWLAIEAKRQRLTAQTEAYKARKALVEAEKSQDAERKLRISAQHDRYVATVNLARQAWDQYNFDRLRQALADTRSAPDRGFEWYYWQRQAHLHLKTFRGHLERVDSMAFSPDGQRIVTGSSDRTARVWDAVSSSELFKLMGHDGPVNSVGFSQDGDRIVTGSDDQTARVWDAATGMELFKLMGHRGSVSSAVFSRDGQRIVTGSHDQTAKVWEVATRRLLVTLEGHTDMISSVAFSPDGKWIVTGSYDQTARVWEAASGRKLHQLVGHSHAVHSVAFFPDGQRIFTGSTENIGRIWEAATGLELPLQRLVGRGTKTSVAISQDSQRVVTGSWGSTATVWNVATGREELSIRGHLQSVRSVAISPDGQRFATGSADGEVKMWETSGERQPLTLRGNMTNVLAVAFSPDGQWIVTGTGGYTHDHRVTGSGDQAAQVWERVSGKKLRSLTGHTSGISSVAFSPDSRRIITGSGDRTAKVWDATTGRVLLTLEGHTASISSVAISSDGQQIVTGSLDRTARVWDAATGRELYKLIGHISEVCAVAFSRDGQRIVTGGSFDQTARVWDAATGLLVRKFETPMRRVTCVAFSPDDRWIAAGGWPRTAMIWELGTNREPLTLNGHTTVVTSVAFSPDGQRIVTGSFDQTARVWESTGGRELLVLKGHTNFVSSVAFSPDGQQIVTGGHDQSAMLWETARADQVAAWEEEERFTEQSIVGWRQELAALQREQAAVQMRQRISLARDDEGAIKRWLVLTPIQLNPDENGAQAMDAEQIKGESQLHPKAGDRVIVGTVELKWQEVVGEDYVINFDAISRSETPGRMAYAVCYIRSDAEQHDLQLLLGCNGRAKVYLNGTSIYKTASSGHFTADRESVPRIFLKAGLNVLIIKVGNETKGWQGSLRLTDDQGNPVRGLRITLNPK